MDHLNERLVDLLEALCLLWQLLDDVSAAEHRLHVNPHVLHDEPHLDDVTDGGQLGDPLRDGFLERRGVSIRGHRPERHLRILQLLHQLTRGAGVEHALSLGLEHVECEVLVLPVPFDLLELRLHLRLFVGPAGELLNLLLFWEQVGVNQVLQLEGVLRHVQFDACKIHQRAPVSRPHRGARQRLYQRQKHEEIVDLLSQIRVRVPVAQRLGKLAARRLEPAHLLCHRLDVRHHICPQDVGVPVYSGDHLRVQIVQRAEELEFLLRLLELGVGGDR